MQGLGAIALTAILICSFGPCRGWMNGPGKNATSRDPMPEIYPTTPRHAVTTSTGFDPVNRPTDVVAIIDDVSARTGTPAGIIYGIWRNETSEVYGDRGGAGGCLAMTQYDIRDKWLSRPNGQANKEALRRIAGHSGWNAETVQASCGTTTETYHVSADRSKGIRGTTFGGCIGPMQITPSEWVDDPEIADKDPLQLYWAMYGASKRLKKDHDRWVAKGKSDHEGWSIAVRDYAGNRDGLIAWNYFANKVVPKWREWRQMRKDGTLMANVSALADRRGRKHRTYFASK